MGLCGGCCKMLMIVWSVIGVLMSLVVVGWMAFKIQGITEEQESPVYLLMDRVLGTGWYKNVSINQIHKYCWYAGLGLGTLMFISLIIHVVSTCKSSKCLLSLSTLLLLIVFGADIAGIVFKFEVINSIGDQLVPSLNSTIVNEYNNDKKITKAWNTLSEKLRCCGVNGVQDFKYAKHWNYTKSPCPGDDDHGCLPAIKSLYVFIHDIWLTSLIAAKAFFIFLVLMHTFCVFKYGFTSPEHSGYADVESYSMQRKK